MLSMQQKLTLGSITLYSVGEVTLSSSRLEPIDILTVKLPDNAKFDRKKIAIGDSVKWQAGYDSISIAGKNSYGLKDEFEGEITEISPGKPIVITAKDAMFKSQFQIVKKDIYNLSLSQVADLLKPSGYSTSVMPEIAGLKISIPYARGRSARWALQKLATQKYQIDVFFREDKLILQKPFYLITPTKPFTFRMGFNVIEDKLGMRSQKDMKVLIKSYDPQTGKVNEDSFGNTLNSQGQENELKVLILDGIKKADIKKKAEAIYMEIAGPGLTGSFKTFGAPSIQHSDIIFFEDFENSARTRNVFIEKVVKTYDVPNAMYSQEIFPGIVQFGNQAVKLNSKLKKSLLSQGSGKLK